MAPIGYLETGVIYCDDNLHRLSQFPADCVDLIYLDPPFFSNRHYEVIWGDEAEVRSFEDRWEGGIRVYIEWMRERVMELHRLLKPTGSLFLHCDWHAAHQLRVMLDDVFGEEHFRNEIIWAYTGPGSPGMRQFNRKHDNIYWYSKGREWTFNGDAVRVAHSGKTVENFRTGLVGSGFVAGDQEAVRGLHAAGKVPEDWWQIAIAPRGKEYLGYPTQKPEALMARIILAASNDGDIVLDPFCGCGTTLAVAQMLRRKWIGIDISPTAVDLESRRLTRLGATDIKLVGMPVTEAQLRALKPFEFQNWVINRMNGTHSARKSGDMGIDGFSFMLHEPIQVKQSGVGRPTVDSFQAAIDRTGKAKGYIVGFSFSRDAHEEVARIKSQGITIQLVTVSDLLQEGADVVTPQPGLLMADPPMPEPRPPGARPSVEELVASDQAE